MIKTIKFTMRKFYIQPQFQLIKNLNISDSNLGLVFNLQSFHYTTSVLKIPMKTAVWRPFMSVWNTAAMHSEFKLAIVSVLILDTTRFMLMRHTIMSDTQFSCKLTLFYADSHHHKYSVTVWTCKKNLKTHNRIINCNSEQKINFHETKKWTHQLDES